MCNAGTSSLRRPFKSIDQNLQGDTFDVGTVRWELVRVENVNYRWFLRAIPDRVRSPVSGGQGVAAKAPSNLPCTAPSIFVKKQYLVNGNGGRLDDSTSFWIEPKDVAKL